MSPEFEQKLHEDFPSLFPKALPIEVDDGWYNLVYATCARIENYIDNWERNRALILNWNLDVDDHTIEWTRFGPREKREVPPPAPQVQIIQIKEKFGFLRIYYTGSDSYIQGVVDMAEEFSKFTCEQCGKPGTSSHKGWIKILCEEHMEEQEIRNAIHK